MPLVQPAAPQLSPAAFVRALSKVRWGWQVELAVLQRLDTDRRLHSISSGLRSNSTSTLPSAGAANTPRLYDLYAAASDEGGRMALAALVRSRSNDTSLLSCPPLV